METQLKRRKPEKEIQVYYNEFFHGILILARKLFMF